jgi:pyruvate kinase
MRANGSQTQIHELIEQLEHLREEMVRMEAGNLSKTLPTEHRPGARNLLHYVALRQHDLRELQQQLSELGLSSLGRTESHVLETIRAVLGMLGQLARLERNAAFPAHQTAGLLKGPKLLEQHTGVLFGPTPESRKVRIMVTMPSEAATDAGLVRSLLTSGMNCMRVNCAHDGPSAWTRMIRNLRRAEKETGRHCKVEMDLAGPKLRTGPIEPGPAVVKCRPKRDKLGRVVTPARVWLTPAEHPEQDPGGAAACLPMPAAWLLRLQPGSRIRYTDTRGSKRTMHVRERVGKNCWAEQVRTGYIAPGLKMIAIPADKRSKHSSAAVGPLPATTQTLRLRQGDVLILTRALKPGRPAQLDPGGQVIAPARIAVTLPEFFDCVQPHDPIWFDDGSVGGVIAEVTPNEAVVKIVQARPNGEKLRAGKGINIPETDLRVPALTKDDLKALPLLAKNADIVGFSFVKTAADVRDLRQRLAKLGRADLGIVLKIETRQGFENLPELLMDAMHGGPVGVMIARGDLAVECGYERLAEIQEEILWISEAAHVPVVWATQVLETLAKEGRPSRSEITDAAMGERAECVMLNKGPFIVEAVQALNDILGRMQAHQEKKTAKLRKLNIAGAFSPASGMKAAEETMAGA